MRKEEKNGVRKENKPKKKRGEEKERSEKVAGKKGE